MFLLGMAAAILGLKVENLMDPGPGCGIDTEIKVVRNAKEAAAAGSECRIRLFTDKSDVIPMKGSMCAMT